jgi:hemolysin activation/secretion protein
MVASPGTTFVPLECGAMLPPRSWCARVLTACLLAVFAASPAAADGAWSFESARKLYGVKTVRAEDVVVPEVVVDETFELPRGVGDGPEFEVKSYEVVGATLLTPSEIQATLRRYLGKSRYMSDVQAARDALQAKYEERGFRTVAVSLPKQTLLDGRIRIEVVEARLGAVTIENPGIDWYSIEGVREATPHLETGALVRGEDLDEDLGRANRPLDRRVTPVLKAGAEPGTVDVDLKVDDRIPLHGFAEWNNYRTPGTPRQRMTVGLSYENIWQAEHESSLQYTFVPNGRDFDDVQVWVLTYGAPNPWREGDKLFAYAAWSDTTTILATAAGLNSLGNGFTSGLRYSLGIPNAPIADPEWYQQSLLVGFDYKSIESDLIQGPNSIKTPIRYLPWTVTYQGTVVRPQLLGTIAVGTDFHFAGTIPSGGSKEDFQNNRGGIRDDSQVDGTYFIYHADFDATIRLPALLQTLGQGRFLDLPPPRVSYDDDASLVVSLSGQYADEPLVSVEQFPIGGRNSVRGYLEGEGFGDHGWDLQTEIRTPALRDFLGGFLGEKIQGLVFWDLGEIYLRDTLDDRIDAQGRIQGVGIGTRASIAKSPFGSLSGEAFLAMPTIETVNTKRTPHLFFQVRAEF